MLDLCFEEFTISLKDFVDNDKVEMLLCPVQAKKYYLRRTKQLLPTCDHLFISTARQKCVSKNTTSFRLCFFINEAYKTTSDGDRRMVKAKAHVAGSTGTSKHFGKNTAVHQIVGAGK